MCGKNLVTIKYFHRKNKGKLLLRRYANAIIFLNCDNHFSNAQQEKHPQKFVFVLILHSELHGLGKDLRNFSSAILTTIFRRSVIDVHHCAKGVENLSRKEQKHYCLLYHDGLIYYTTCEFRMMTMMMMMMMMMMIIVIIIIIIIIIIIF